MVFFMINLAVAVYGDDRIAWHNSGQSDRFLGGVLATIQDTGGTPKRSLNVYAFEGSTFTANALSQIQMARQFSSCHKARIEMIGSRKLLMM